MTRVHTVEFVGVPVVDYETDSIQTGAVTSLGIGQLCKGAGAEYIEDGLLHALRYSLRNDRRPHEKAEDAATRKEYTDATGREFPRMYQFKITVEAVPLSDEATKAEWTRWAEYFNQ